MHTYATLLRPNFWGVTIRPTPNFLFGPPLNISDWPINRYVSSHHTLVFSPPKISSQLLQFNAMSLLQPPEELEYATYEIAEAAIQEHAKQQGYAVSRNKVYNDKKGDLRRMLCGTLCRGIVVVRYAVPWYYMLYRWYHLCGSKVASTSSPWFHSSRGVYIEPLIP